MSLPIELYWEIFSQSDFATTLRFRSTYKAFTAFHTAATREHSQVSSTIEAVALRKTILLKAMTTARVPQFVPHLNRVMQIAVIGEDDLPWFQSLVADHGLDSVLDYARHLGSAAEFDARCIVNYILSLNIIPDPEDLLSEVTPDSPQMMDRVRWLASMPY